MTLLQSKQRSNNTSGVLLGWDSNSNTNKFLVLEAELVRVSVNIIIVLLIAEWGKTSQVTGL